MPTALSVRGLIKRFESTCAVDGVDLDLEAGEVRGLLGPNGAGKTTLLRMLLGLVVPDAGSIELLGRPLRWPDGGLSEGVAGFVEEPCFYPYFSGRANLELLGELDGGVAPARIDDALATVGLSDRSEERLSGYSTGMRQRLGIAASLMRRPRLLLLDEPTSGLDPAGARDVRALVHDLARSGVAVLVSSHLIGEVHDACDSFTVLRRGTVVWSGTSAQLRAQAPQASYALSTSNDARALELARNHGGVEVASVDAGGLSLSVREGALDAYVVALGTDGVAIRRLEPLDNPLELMFFALTDETASARASP
jgi:ABC-2 type transport system ATP-binding protein